jgi:hypothetical protein
VQTPLLPTAYLAIKATWTQQGRVQNVCPVGCCNDDDACVALKAIHLCEQLVQSLLPLIVTTTNACSRKSSLGCLTPHTLDDPAHVPYPTTLHGISHRMAAAAQ